MGRFVMTAEEEVAFVRALDIMGSDGIRAEAGACAEHMGDIVRVWIDDDTDIGVRDEVAEAVFWNIDYFVVCFEKLVA